MNQHEQQVSIHELIEGEFRPALSTAEYEVSPDTDGVVVLSAYEFTAPEGEAPLDLSVSDNAENLARIQMGATLVRDVAAQRVGKTPDELTDDDMRSAPPFILNGTTTQLPYMEQLAAGLGFSTAQLRLIDCGPVGKANTKTQMKAMLPYAAQTQARHITLVTSDYHLPRVARTATKQLEDIVDFDVVRVPHNQLPDYDVSGVVKGEVRRIGAYAAKGDISWHPKSK